MSSNPHTPGEAGPGGLIVRHPPGVDGPGGSIHLGGDPVVPPQPVTPAADRRAALTQHIQYLTPSLLWRGRAAQSQFNKQLVYGLMVMVGQSMGSV